MSPLWLHRGSDVGAGTFGSLQSGRHVMSRGDRREAIFLDDVDRQDFLRTLAEACQKTGWQVHAYCLMNNHFHLVVETPDANLVEGMRWLLSAYTIRLNHRHKIFGHVFSGRYKALLVEGGNGVTIKAIAARLHLGTSKSANARLHVWMRSPTAPKAETVAQ